MNSYSKLSACPRSSARHVLSLSYSLCCCCSLLPSYLYNKASHSPCDSFICVQFKGNPSKIWFSPCQDLVCAAVLWAVTSFWFYVLYKYLYRKEQVINPVLFLVWSAEWTLLSRSVGFALRDQNYLQAVLKAMITGSFPFKMRAQNIWNKFLLNA